jgi:YebC/PmpR family DNA-binding regulatory protein
MSGHNKWSKIKHKKASTDAKKSKEFSKLSKLITMEAKAANGNLDSPGLKLAIEKAKKANMPNDNIDRAVKKATEADGADLIPILYEAYGPGGAAILIETLTDSRNRTAGEIKHLLSTHGTSLAEPGAAAWAFEKKESEFVAKVEVPLKENDKEKTQSLVEKLLDHDDVQNVFINTSL